MKTRLFCLLGAVALVACMPASTIAQCADNGSGQFVNDWGTFNVEGGQINLAGATLLVDFFFQPASTNDWIDVDQDGLWGFNVGDPINTPDQLAKRFPPTTPPFDTLNTYWVFNYRSVGSVNGFNEFVANQLCGFIPTEPTSEAGIFNGFQYADGGEVTEGWQGANRSGTPLQQCEIEGAFLDVPGSWAVNVPGAPNWDRRPASAGYGLNPIDSNTGYSNQLKGLCRDCAVKECQVWQCDVSGNPCFDDDDCGVEEACVFFSTNNDACVNDSDCVGDEFCRAIYECSVAGTWCLTDGDCPGGETCEPVVNPEVCLNVDTATPDGDTVFDVPVAWTPVSFITNRGTGRDKLDISEAHYLWTTGRSKTGENLAVACRDVGSGTRNDAMNGIGIDTSWGRGDNTGDKNKLKGNAQLGPDHQVSNSGGSSVMEEGVQSRRIAVGYTGLAGGSRSAKDAADGKYEILAVRKDIDGDFDGHIDCSDVNGYVFPTVDSVVDNCDPCTGYQVGAFGSFTFRGNVAAAREPGARCSISDEPCLADEDCGVDGGVCEVQNCCTGQARVICEIDADCPGDEVCGGPCDLDSKWEDSVAPDNKAVADYMNNILDSIDQFDGDTFPGQCLLSEGISCEFDSDCKTCDGIEDGAPCANDNDCNIGETCMLPAGEQCQLALNTPGEFLATGFFLPAALDCSHVLTNPTEYFDGPTNSQLRQFTLDNNNLGWGAAPDGSNYAYGQQNTAGRTPNRQALAIGGDLVYSDGVRDGLEYYYWDGAWTTANSSATDLSKRNRIAGDANGDGVRDINDADELVLSYYMPRKWQKRAIATGNATGFDLGEMSADNAIPEVMNDFDGDGNYTKEDLRYWMDGLALVEGSLNRTAGAIAIDEAIAGFGTCDGSGLPCRFDADCPGEETCVVTGKPFPWADAGDHLFIPNIPAPEFNPFPPVGPLFAPPASIGNYLANTGNPYKPGDFRADVAGAFRESQKVGAEPNGWDGMVNDADLDYVCANFGDWSDLDQAVYLDLSCDMNGDLVIDIADITDIVENVLLTTAGDTDLDGDVDQDDIDTINGNLNDPNSCHATGTCGWADGDFDCDGFVDPINNCPFDLDNNGAVGPGDVGVVKNSFGCDINLPECAALDFDNNGAVGPGDVGAVKNNFGPCGE